MKIYDNTKYAFITSIIRAMESRMLNSGEVERMIEAKNAKESLRVLNDLDYASFLGNAERPEDFQVIINEGLKEVKDLLEENAPYPNILDVLWLRFDFHNLKVLLKGKIKGKDFADLENMLMPYGKYDFEKLQSFLNAPTELDRMKMSDVEMQIRNAVQEAEVIFEAEQDPTFIDGVLDKKYFEIINKELKTFQIDFLTKYHCLSVDLTNIRIYLRCVTLDKENLFEKLFIGGGTLTQDSFKGNLSEFNEKMQATSYRTIVEEGVKEYEANQSFAKLEKDIDALLLEHMSTARFISLGVEPLFAFFWMKENNAQVIRTIMVNKLNDIAPVEIRKKIRKLYQ